MLITGTYTLLRSGAADELGQLAISVNRFFSQLVARATSGSVEEFMPTRQDQLMHFGAFILMEEHLYVDGVSVTHGPAGSRQHIWTFAAALYDDDPNYCVPCNCPCTNTRYNWTYNIPSFIQNNYFCDTGNTGPSWGGGGTYYSDDPLWDGAGCGENSTCCQFNNPPWIYSSLPQATRDDVEVRICFSYHGNHVVIYQLEIYVAL